MTEVGSIYIYVCVCVCAYIYIYIYILGSMARPSYGQDTVV